MQFVGSDSLVDRAELKFKDASEEATFDKVRSCWVASTSTGQWAHFPLRKVDSDLDIGLAVGTDDGAYDETLSAVLRQVRAYEPDLVLYQAGVDPLVSDRLGRMNLTHQGLRTRNQRVFDQVREWDVPCVVFMGGGYSDPIDPTVAAFVDVFAQAAISHCAR